MKILKDSFFNPVPKLVYSIHNISYQGRFPEDHWPILSLPRSYYTYDFEFYGQINLTKSAIHLADVITTVSETYAREIQTTDLGFGLQDDLQGRKENLYGILNGVDYQEWCPESDPYTYGIHYTADDMSGKRRIKSKLRKEYGLPDTDNVPLIGMTTRFVEQKGIGLVTECAEQILQLDTQMIVLGSGDQRYHDFFGLAKNGSFLDRKAVIVFRQFVDGHEKMAIKDPLYCKPLRLEMISWNQSSTGCGITGFSLYNIWYEIKNSKK